MSIYKTLKFYNIDVRCLQQTYELANDVENYVILSVM